MPLQKPRILTPTEGERLRLAIAEEEAAMDATKVQVREAARRKAEERRAHGVHPAGGAAGVNPSAGG